MNIYSDHISEIDSFESRYKNVLFRNNNLVIPYFNLMWDESFIHSNKVGELFLDYAYMVFIDVSYLRVYINKKYVVIDKQKDDEMFFLGGKYLDYGEKIFNDMEICCSKSYLQTTHFTKFSNSMWNLFDTSTVKKNSDNLFFERFMNHEYMPENIKILIE